MAVLARPTFRELFDRHASFTIDSLTYRTNPTLRDLADRIIDRRGFTSGDIPNTGVTVYRTHATFDVWENTTDGKPMFKGDRRARRTVVVDFDPEAL